MSDLREQTITWRERLTEAKVESIVHVAMQDVDISRIHFASVFSFIDRNEVQLFKLLGISLSRLMATGFAMPVISAHCEYKKPFGLDDIVTVTSYVSDIGTRSIKLRHVTTDQDGEILADAYTVHVPINENTTTSITLDELFEGMGL
ncbi:MAG: acyl-CoA thioesterase [Acidimicrobiaceae bacterium]|nr:acyl-CoA thioesterase [Acidimicrobiaceae bacterium]